MTTLAHCLSKILESRRDQAVRLRVDAAGGIVKTCVLRDISSPAARPGSARGYYTRGAGGRIAAIETSSGTLCDLFASSNGYEIRLLFLHALLRHWLLERVRRERGMSLTRECVRELARERFRDRPEGRSRLELLHYLPGLDSGAAEELDGARTCSGTGVRLCGQAPPLFEARVSDRPSISWAVPDGAFWRLSARSFHNDDPKPIRNDVYDAALVYGYWCALLENAVPTPGLLILGSVMVAVYQQTNRAVGHLVLNVVPSKPFRMPCPIYVFGNKKMSGGSFGEAKVKEMWRRRRRVLPPRQLIRECSYEGAVSARMHELYKHRGRRSAVNPWSNDRPPLAIFSVADKGESGGCHD
jgi:hypothetical protein